MTGLLTRLKAARAKTKEEKEEIIDLSDIREALTKTARDLSKQYSKSKNPRTKEIRDNLRRIALEVSELFKITRKLQLKRNKLFADILPLVKNWKLAVMTDNERKEKTGLKAKLLRKKEQAQDILDQIPKVRTRAAKLVKDINKHLNESEQIGIETVVNDAQIIWIRHIKNSVIDFEKNIKRALDEIDTVLNPTISDITNLAFNRNEKNCKANLLRVAEHYA